MRSRVLSVRRTVLAAVVASVFPVASIASDRAPTLRILSSRSAGSESSSSEVVFERAGGMTGSAAAQPTTAAPGAAAGKPPPGGAAAAAARPAGPQPHGSAAPTPASPKLTVGRPPAEPGSAEDRRIKALNRVAAMNQATGPRDAGVPQSPGSGAEAPPPAKMPPARPAPKAAPAPAAPQSRLLSERAPRSQAPAPPPAKPAAPVDKPKTDLSPVPGKANPEGDPLASEIAREGEFYFFTGTVNGLPVRFRINQEITGIRMPTRVASVAKALPPGSANMVASKGEVLAPIHTISFGAYPVRSVMVKIYSDESQDFVDIGEDALANFKIKSVNGRRLLVKS